MTAPRREPALLPMAEQRTWPAASEAWFRKVLATFPPIGPRQRERLAKLLDLGGGHDGAA